MNRLITILIFNFLCSQIFNTTQGTEHSSISDALAAANTGDTIQASPGTYNESFSIQTSINLEGSPGSIIDASNQSTAIVIKSNDINISGFEVIGNENTGSGFSVEPGSTNIHISDNIIHGMGLANSSNESPLSYGIVVWGNDTIPNPPINININNNEIYDVTGSGISLGEITQDLTITNNYIHDINGVILSDNIVPDQDFTSIGINGLFADNVLIANNTFENITVATTLGISNGIIENNTYNNVPVFFSSLFFNTADDDDFQFTESIDYWRSTKDVQNILSMYSYCNTFQLAQDTADEGTTILTSNGEEIVQDCSSVWGGENLPLCNTCETTFLGDANLDNFVDILDVVQIINYLLLDTVDFTDSQLCLSDLDLNMEINILDIVILVQSIIS